MAKANPTQIAILQTLAGGNSNNHTYTVNGFPTVELARVRSDVRTSQTFPGFDTKMEEFIVLHHYFLRPGENRITGEYVLGEPEDVNKSGSLQLSARVVSTQWPLEKRPGESYVLRELTTFQSPMLSRTGDDRAPLEANFVWKTPLPAWGWTHGIAIEDSPATRKSLYQAYVRFHDSLDALHATPTAAGAESPFIAATRASMKEFIQACEMRKAPYHLLDDLAYAAVHLSTPIIEERAKRDTEEGVRNQPNVVASDDRQLEPKPPLDQNGKRMNWLTLQALPADDKVNFEVFAGGTLAKLTGLLGKPMIVYIFNGHGGSRGTEQFFPLICIDVWFRREADGGWAVDGLWSRSHQSMTVPGPAPSEFLSDLMNDDRFWGAE